MDIIRKKAGITAKAVALAMAAALTVSAAGCSSGTAKPGKQLKELIGSGEAVGIKARLTEVIACEPVGEYRVAQGAACDGSNVYFILRLPEDGNGIIVKYDLKTGKYINKSEPIYVFHGNDMTYDSGKKLLYVAHGSSEGKILTAVDPETLSVTEQSIAIERGAGAITYSPGRNSFAISQGGKSLHFLDSGLKYVRSAERSKPDGYTAQGMGSDEEYIFFPMSGSSDNILQIFDWNGDEITTVTLPTQMESESAFWSDGVYYVNFNYDGARLYRVDFE